MLGEILPMIFQKQTIIEITLLCFLLILPFGVFFIVLFFLYDALKVMAYISLKPSEKIKETQMTGAIYSSEGFFEFSTKEQIPKISSTQILVRVYSCALNPADYKMIFCKLPIIRWILLNNKGIGKDFSGKVVDVGSEVKSFKVGDEVFGRPITGVLQEYAVTNENLIALKPKNVSFNEAASFPLAALTSYQVLTWFFDSLEGKEVLIIGASGGTGSFAVQISKYLKAKSVYGVCSSKNSDFVKTIGADVVLEYDKKNYLEDLKKNAQKFDLIFDTVTSSHDKDQYPIYSQFLKEDGKWECINGKIFVLLKALLVARLIGKTKIFDPKNKHCHFLTHNKKDLNLLKQMIEEGAVKTVIDVLPFDKKGIASGFEKLKSRRTRGKIVIEVTKDL